MPRINIEPEKNKKLSEEQCRGLGGHHWKYWDSNEDVDENFNRDYTIPGVRLMQNPKEYRGCPVCGKKQELIPATWVDYIEPEYIKQTRLRDEGRFSKNVNS